MLVPTPVVKDLVLVGGGHSHIEVIRKFGMKPLPGVRLTLVTRDVHTPYSGMLPGYVSGFYTYDECHVDLARLSKFAKARFIHAEARGIDTQAQEVLLHGRPSIPYDLLSINIGITPAASTVPGASQHTTGVKPIDRFVVHFDKLLQRVQLEEGAPRVVVVGGGAAGVELACALQYRLKEERRKAGREGGAIVSLVSRGPILSQLAPYARNAFLPLLKARGIALHEVEGGVVEVMSSLLNLGDGSQLPYDECLWCTQAGAAPWVAATGLPTDEGGFVAVNEYLQSDGGPSNVFAAGDIATLSRSPRPKAGVFAVRAGPPLADNLRRFLLGQSLRSFTPQSTYLNLMSAGDKYAVGVKGWLGFQGSWCWGLKDWIDTSFMRKYSTDLDMESMGGVGDEAQSAQVLRSLGGEAENVSAAAKMRCGGCGGKVGASILTRVLQRLRADRVGHLETHVEANHASPRPDVIMGLAASDDAAVIRPPAPGYVTVHTVDYFRSMVDDPFTFGMVAASHALSDCFAMGAKPVAAMAIATVQFGPAGKMESDLYQMMAGACQVLDKEQCELVGGHSSEGAELGLGFSVYGQVKEGRVLSKAGMKPGDALVLTKPLGTGTILAAHMKGAAVGRWVQGAVASMLKSNGNASRILNQYGMTACTDVTGFGLLGHLYEMAHASNVLAVVNTNAVQVLPGACEAAMENHKSSLHNENAKVAIQVEDEHGCLHNDMWPLLIDPQTGGGLLASVDHRQYQQCLAALHEAGYEARHIGTVELCTDNRVFLRLKAS